MNEGPMPATVPAYGGYSNRAETEFAVWAHAQGWAVTKRGWPDFICRRGSEIMCVEVKESTGLSHYQTATATDLAAHGLPTYVWWQQTKELEPVSEATRLLTDEQMSAVEAVHTLGREVQHAQWTAEWLKRRTAKLTARLEALRAERREEQAALERLMDDFGYLLRQAQDYQRGAARRGTYTHRLQAIIRRHPDLAWPELAEDDPTLAELRAAIDGTVTE